MRILTLLTLILLIPNCSRTSGKVITEISHSKKEVKLCLLGDFARSSQQDELIKALKNESCDRLYFLGNNTGPEVLSKTLKPLFKEKKDLTANIVLGPQDHMATPREWKILAGTNNNFFFPDYFYLVDYSGLCIVSLDTSFYHYRKTVDEIEDQKEFMNTISDKLKKCSVKVATAHNSLSSKLSKDFLERYVIGSFDVFVSGEKSLGDQGKKKNTTILNSGNESSPGFVVLTWDPKTPKEISYHLHSIPKRYLAQNVERQEAKVPQLEMDDLIDKEVVEQGPFKRIMNSFKKLMREGKKTEKKETARFRNDDKVKRTD